MEKTMEEIIENKKFTVEELNYLIRSLASTEETILYHKMVQGWENYQLILKLHRKLEVLEDKANEQNLIKEEEANEQTKEEVEEYEELKEVKTMSPVSKPISTTPFVNKGNRFKFSRNYPKKEDEEQPKKSIPPLDIEKEEPKKKTYNSDDDE